jgi:hypothetical protein
MVERIWMSHGYRPIAAALRRPSSGVVMINSIKRIRLKNSCRPSNFNGSLGFAELKVSKFQAISISSGFF